MGYGRWSDEDWKSYAATNIKGKSSVYDIYKAKVMDDTLNPRGIKFRESCDSIANPNSTPVIVALDVTGSMSFILDEMAREGLKELATEIYERRPITDPHMMFMGVGDVKYDEAPLQVTQFEADISIAQQLTKIYLEQGGGGNNCESYTLPWWFAAMHTKCDNYVKRGKKGYLFTIGDECPPKDLSAVEIERVLGYKPEFSTTPTEKLYNLVSRQYEVFHVITEEGYYCSANHQKVVDAWRKVLGQRALLLSDHKKLPELIVSTLQVMAGEDKEEVLDSWDGSTKLVISKAIKDLQKSEKKRFGFIKF